MMKRWHLPTLWLWSMRDVMRRPGESMLIAACLFAFVTLMGTAMMLMEALSETTRTLMDKSPALVVRRIGPYGWTPMSMMEGMHAAESVRGVIHVWPRIWGRALSPAGWVTVMGIPSPGGGGKADGQLFPEPVQGDIIIGSALKDMVSDGTVPLLGVRRMTFRVDTTLDATLDMVAHDLVLMHGEDARDLLGLPKAHVTDLAVDVFHESEQEAIIPDLLKAFPWPVVVTTRQQHLQAYTGDLGRRGSLFLFALIPAMLALLLLVLGSVKDVTKMKRDMGLFRLLGWTTRDVLRFQVLRALIIAIPAISMGFMVSYMMVFWPGMTWPSQLFFGWEGHSPQLIFHSRTLIVTGLQVMALALVPYLAAVVWSTMRGVGADPMTLVQGKGLYS